MATREPMIAFTSLVPLTIKPLNFRIQNVQRVDWIAFKPFLGKMQVPIWNSMHNSTLGNETLVNNIVGGDNTAVGVGCLYFNNDHKIQPFETHFTIIKAKSEGTAIGNQ